MPINESIDFVAINIAVITISDTRTEQDDTSGLILSQLIQDSGHNLSGKTIVKDDKQEIADTITKLTQTNNIDAIITTGGTGLTGRDVTPEALDMIADKKIAGFGELFRMLSYEKIGTSALQSRACAGVCNGVYVFCLPGSNGAVKDGWNGILKYQLDIRHKPCNFVEIMPRLMEK